MSSLFCLKVAHQASVRLEGCWLRGSIRATLAGRVPGRLGSEEEVGMCGLVADHPAVDDVSEVAFEDAAGFLL